MFLSPFSIPGGFEERHKKSSVGVIGSSQNVIHTIRIMKWTVIFRLYTYTIQRLLGLTSLYVMHQRLWDLYMRHNLSGFMHVMTSSLVCSVIHVF
jgi:hypothetical protein